ncbi:uncharacterized protein Bfra_010960 [Botrytis fragariae]|uniref:Uncharacterized protein n=1 Tax=Botrytis fragariae TaxID=1964551 RepID=A0A8H6EFA7_9HELO|nr:uncharacterized protein Bfra_010960 [Botrytis fragariae]KAF5869760.1 hypothetical protein Bfra_010960 [Botrytis fragariae]
MVNIDIKSTSVKTVSQRSQSGIPNGDGEDELSIQIPSLDAHTPQHTSPNNIPESSSKNLTSSVVANSVEKLSQNEAEDSITLPSAKLEEWLKHGIQILRENRRRTKTAGSDPEYEALDNDPELEYLDQRNVEISSSRGRVSGSQSDDQLRRQYSNNSSRQFRNQPWFTTAQGEIVDQFLDRARRNPFNFKQISAESPVIFTIDADELSGFPDDTTCELLRQYWDASSDKDYERSFEIAWEKYYKKLFWVDEFSNVARRQWTLTLQKTWLRRRLIAIRASKDCIIVGICCAELLCKYGSRSGERKAGSVLEFCYDSGVLHREIGSELHDILLLADIIPIFNTYIRLETVFKQVSFQSKFQEWIYYIDIEAVLALELTEFMIIIYFLELGGIKLIWIDVLEEHLLLNLESKELLLAWIRHTLLGYPAGRPEEYCMNTRDVFDPEPSSRSLVSHAFGLNHSIKRTWFMLHTSSKDSKRFYRLISTRSEEPTAKMWKDTDSITSSEYTLLDSYHNLSSSKIESAARNESEIPYACFGHLEHRVRILREYTDKQKPRGFRQLWRDSRDSFNYYTFWGVIIFGAVSVFLAMASLAVSIAQTYASLKSLG